MEPEPTVSPNPLEAILRDLPRFGTCIKNRGYRQIWRFELEDKAYYLKFYPRAGSRWKKALTGNPALAEFSRLQKLQKANVPAPRATHVLVGFNLSAAPGDAVIVEAIEPSITLDHYLNAFKLAGEPIPNHRQLVHDLCELVGSLQKAGLGHSDLHLGNILLSGDKLYLLDGYAMRTGGWKLADLMLLGHSVNRFATRTDFHRGWLRLGPDAPLPLRNPLARRQWRKFVERTTQENAWFGQLESGPWRGFYFKQAKYARRWAPTSAMHISRADWEHVLPTLLDKIARDNLDVLKKSKSGDVYATEMLLAGRSVHVVIKRPYKRYWYRYINEIGRGSRSRRAWNKAWSLVARNIPTAWPLLMLETRTMGYITASIILFERIPGVTLDAADLDAIDPAPRDMLFRRIGHILRQIERLGMSHFDAKSSNWIVAPDDKLGPRPVLIDVDGVRFRKWIALGIQRLLRSMRSHPQYTPADSLSLCLGYAPWSRLPAPESIESESPSP